MFASHAGDSIAEGTVSALCEPGVHFYVWVLRLTAILSNRNVTIAQFVYEEVQIAIMFRAYEVSIPYSFSPSI